MAAPKVKATTKSQIIKNLAESTSLTKKNVTDLLDALMAHIHTDLGKKGVGVFTLPGLCKFKLDMKKAVPAGAKPKASTKLGDVNNVLWIRNTLQPRTLS